MIQLEVKDLVKRFGKKIILNGVNFSVSSGVFGIAGSNGSGKSTLLRCLSYLMTPTKGEINWKSGSTTLDKTLFKQYLGYAAPYLNLYAEFSAKENLAFHAKLKGIEQKDLSHTIEEFARLADVRFSLDQAYGSLSSGQQQRVKLLSAFALQPKIVFLDEPGTNLDEAGNAAVRNLIELARKEEVLVLLASNDAQELDLCDSVHSLN
ncbi:ABC transporter ATP-binding protein [bacterium]|nr:MAG: ABC transporter ATP-binding protein [bacterium]